MPNQLVTAAVLESQYNLRRSTTYRAAQLGLIPSYRVGLKGRGVRFRVDEVLSVLRRPKAGCEGAGFESVASILPEVLQTIADNAESAARKTG